MELQYAQPYIHICRWINRRSIGLAYSVSEKFALPFFYRQRFGVITVIERPRQVGMTWSSSDSVRIGSDLVDCRPVDGSECCWPYGLTPGSNLRRMVGFNSDVKPHMRKRGFLAAITAMRQRLTTAQQDGVLARTSFFVNSFIRKRPIRWG